ncbi:MAG: PAS domain S-box protein [Promethearchaeota archaeon]
MIKCKNKVLIVDDDPHILKILKVNFKRKGYKVIGIASNGQIAVNLYKSYSIKPDFVLMDYKMPIMNGLEATKEILEVDEKARIIFISGNLEIKDLALASGAIDFISKPINFNNIIQSFNKINKSQLEEIYSFKENGKFNKLVKELGKNEAELTAIYNYSPNAIFILDRERRINKINKFALQIAKRLETEVIGVRAGEVFRCINSIRHPRGCGFSENCQECKIRNTIMDSFQTKMPHINIEVSLSFLSSSELNTAYFLISTVPLKVYNEDLVLVSLIDITERKNVEKKLKESEEKYRNLIENAQEGVWVVDENDDTLFINPKICEMLGYTREEIMGKNLKLFLEDPMIELINTYRNRREKSLKDTYEFEFIKKDGNILSTLINAAPIFNDNGEFKGSFAFINDISKRKIAEKKLKESEEKYRKAFEQADLYKDLFLHDMNNIIGVIQGSIELYSLLKGSSEELKKKNEMIENISDSVNKAKKLISNIRTLSEIENLEEESLINIDILKFLNEAKKFTSNNLYGREINIEFDFAFKFIFVQANNFLLGVFENILNNAVKYNNNPIVEITIRISKSQFDDKNFIKIEFIDNGIGISDECKKYIFKKGYNNIKGGKGLGFGLSVVKKVIEMYKGKVWIEDRIKGDYSKGSNFILLIPEGN